MRRKRQTVHSDNLRLNVVVGFHTADRGADKFSYSLSSSNSSPKRRIQVTAMVDGLLEDNPSKFPDPWHIGIRPQNISEITLWIYRASRQRSLRLESVHFHNGKLL